MGFETIKITEKDLKNRIKVKKKKKKLPLVSPYLEGTESVKTMYGD
jgi:hypothetical protein